MKFQMLVLNPQNEKEIIEYRNGEQVTYYDSAKILWDEGKSGPLPAHLKAEHQAQEDAKKAALEQKEAEKLARREIIKGAKNANTVAKLQAVVEALAKELRLD